MQILQGLNGLRQLPGGMVLSIGNFDGVHLGHAHILARAAQLATGIPGGKLAVATFEPHPLTVLRPELAPPRLTTPSRKEAVLCQAGIDYLVTLPPEPGVLNLSAEDFWKILRDDVRPAWLVEGNSFNFGKNRGGNIEKLNAWAASSNVRLDIVSSIEVALLDLSVVPVSSSLIRWLLQQGRVRDAAICLGRAYELEGEVIRGHQRGQAIGVPTANLRCVDQLLPADGVYAGRCRLDDIIHAAAISIGKMPTFGDNARQVEVHLIGFSDNLYGRVLRVEVLDWVRDQRKFSGIEPLKQRLARDIEIAATRKCDNPSRPIAAIEQGV